MVLRAVLLGWFALSLSLSACVSQVQCQRSSDPFETERCVGTGGATEAAMSAGAAAGAWAAVGCRVNGCNPPYVCNDDTGLCERMRCGEGKGCPPAYHCDLERYVCR